MKLKDTTNKFRDKSLHEMNDELFRNLSYELIEDLDKKILDRLIFQNSLGIITEICNLQKLHKKL